MPVGECQARAHVMTEVFQDSVLEATASHFDRFADFDRILKPLIPLRNLDHFASGLVGDFGETYRPQRQTASQRLASLESLQERLHREKGAVEKSLSDFEEFQRALDREDSLDKLRQIHGEMMAWAAEQVLREGSVVSLQERLTRFRDRLTRRLIDLASEEMAREGFGLPPTPYAWIAMGSDGRGEQLFATDQDHLLVFEASAKSREVLKRLPESLLLQLLRFDRGETIREIEKINLTDRYYARFCQKVGEFLHQVGIERCKGHIMPAYDKWRGTIARWERRLIGKVRYGAGELTVLDMNILMDSRFVAGDPDLAGKFLTLLKAYLPENPDILNQIAHSAILMPIALGMFRRLKVKKSGPQKGTLNLKLNGWAPLTILVRVLCVKNRLFETHTLKRLDLLAENNLLDRKIARDLQEAYHHLILFRALFQMNHLARGRKEDNHIDPSWLDPEGQELLRKSLGAVEAFQNQINRSFFGGTV